MGFACVRCGQSLPPEARFCLHCGTSLDGPGGFDLPWDVSGPRFVGRQEEAAGLARCWEEVRAAAAARVVGVVGAPGAGKTRLVSDVLSEKGVSARAVCCSDAGESLGLGPVARLVLDLGDAGSGADPATLRARLQEGLGTPDALVARLLGHVGLGPATASVDDLPGDLALVLRALTEKAPLALVLEDVETAAPRLRSVLVAALAACRDLPLLVVVTSVAQDQVADFGPDVVLALGPLPARDVARLLLEALSGSPVVEQLAVPVATAAAGSPLHLEQLVTLLVETGSLRRSASGWELSGLPDRLPAGLGDVLAERIGHLPADERQVVECAAVLGVDMGLGELLALAAGGPDPSAALARLVQRQLLAVAREGHAFRFHHPAVRDAAYAATPTKRLAELHLRAADHFEHVSPVLRERIAVHLERAVALHAHLEPVVLLEPLARRTARAWHDLGTAALLVGELPGARQCLERALSAVPPGAADRPALLQGLAEVQLELGETQHAIQLSREARALAEHANDEAVRLRAELCRLRGETVLGAVAAREVVAPLRATATRLEARREWQRAPRAWLAVARTAHEACDWDAAAAAATRASRRARETASPDLGAALALTCSLAAYGPQPVPAAREVCRDALRQLSEGTVPAALCTVAAAWLVALDGEAESSRDLGAAAVQVSRWRGVPLVLGEVLTVVGRIALQQGRWEDAVAAFTEAEGVLRARGHAAGLPGAFQALARARAGDLAGSREALARSSVAGDANTLGIAGLVELTVARAAESVLLRSSDPMSAVAAADAAVRIATRTRIPVLEGDAWSLLGEALQHVGAQADTRDAWDAAREHYQAKGAHAPVAALDHRTAVS